MTRVAACNECGDRERVGFQRNGVCRECRGVEVGERLDAETTDDPHREQANRKRVIDNTRVGGSQ